MSVRNGDITSGIESQIWRSIHKSIDNNSVETFSVLRTFIKRILLLSIREKSIDHFQRYIFFPAAFYTISYSKKEHDPSLDQMHKYCTQQGASLLKETIWLDIGFSVKVTEKQDEIKKLNEFYYWAFNGFGRLLYRMVMNQDLKQFKEAIEEFEQITETSYGRKYELRYEISNLKRTNIEGENDGQIKMLEDQYENISQFDSYKRHTLLGVKYWILFLYRVDYLKEAATLDFIDLIKVHYTDYEEILDDLMLFRKGGLRRYMEWGEWDHVERKSGVVFTPPNPREWLTMGFAVDQYRENIVVINSEAFQANDHTEMQFLYDDMKKYTELFSDNFDKWKKVLKLSSKELLEQKSVLILSVFKSLKRKSFGEMEQTIANAPLSVEKVNSFIEDMGKAWRSEARIHDLFRNFGVIEHIDSEDVKLKQIGFRTFYEKAKMMFIDGEFHSVIYGSDRLGGEVGRWEDSEFFNMVFRSEHNRVTGTNILDTLKNTIAHLKKNEVIPDLIMLPMDSGYRTGEVANSKLFKTDSEVGDTSLFKRIGTFDEIPVFVFLSDLLRNRVIVCDFKSAFKLRYKTNENWYESELNVNVQEISEEEAKRKLLENPEKWTVTEDGTKISEEDALTLVKTSIIIECWSTIDFQVIDVKNFAIGYAKLNND